MDIKLTTTTQQLNLSLPQIGVDLGSVTIGSSLPRYEGSYKVTPDFTEQRLSTADRTMAEDVVVETIPIYTTGNDAGGNTIIIGG